jgi:hypothetical protein
MNGIAPTTFFLKKREADTHTSTVSYMNPLTQKRVCRGMLACLALWLCGWLIVYSGTQFVNELRNGCTPLLKFGSPDLIVSPETHGSAPSQPLVDH